MDDFLRSILTQRANPTPTQAPDPRQNLVTSLMQGIRGMFTPATFAYTFRQPSATTTPASTPTPLATAAPTMAPKTASGGFKYQMGQKDYSNIASQVQSVLKGTPLEPYSNDFIQAGNKYGVDPRVLVTIAHNESSLGKNYPQDTYNPFGYNARGAGNVVGPDGKTYVNTDAGLKGAGFTSLPMAIDRLTGRFQRQPTQGYQAFYKDPTIANLQAAYNASDAEKDRYINNANDFVSNFQ